MEKSKQKVLLRVLCLHGWGTNKSILEYQLRQFKKIFDNIEFIALNGPNEIDSTYVTMIDPSLSLFIQNYEKRCFCWFEYFHENPFDDMDKTINYKERRSF